MPHTPALCLERYQTRHTMQAHGTFINASGYTVTQWAERLYTPLFSLATVSYNNSYN